MAKESNVISEYHLNLHQPEKPQFAIHDLKSYVNRNKGNTTRPHIHSYYQVIWFRKGDGVHFVDFKSYQVKDNTVFFTAKNQVHYFDDNLEYEGFLIHFNEAFLVRKENETDFCLKCSLFNNPYSQFPFCTIDEKLHDVLNEYLKQIENELQNPEEFGKEELLRNYLKSFLIQLQREKSHADKDENFSSSVFDEKRMLLIKFIDLIDDNYNKGMTISEYAGILQVSTRTLSDLTHLLISKTPSLMIQERIILEAQRMLLYSNLNVNQIGYRLGFDDPSYFVKYFKKHTQSSPSDFRKAVS